MQYDIDIDDSDDIPTSDDDESTSVNNAKIKKINKKMDIKDAVKSIDERALYASIDKFFKNECTSEQLDKMTKIIEKDDKISLRLLNWFSMKYSSSMEGMEIRGKNGRLEIFHVRISYKARLKAHSKKYFDPFRRGKRFDYSCNEKIIETTLCQLNFFKWLLTYNLIAYVEKNYDNLVKKMAVYEKKKKDVKNKKLEKKTTKEKCVPVKTNNFSTDDVKLVLTF